MADASGALTITIPARDGYPLAATVFAPAAPQAVVLINSATAVPRKIYRGFADLSGRTRLCRPHLRLSRHRRLAAGFAERIPGADARLGDAGCGRRRRLRAAHAGRTCRSPLSGIRSAGRRSASSRTTPKSRAPAGRVAGRRMAADSIAGKLPRLSDDECARAAGRAGDRLCAGQDRARRRPAEDVFLEWADWVASRAISSTIRRSASCENFPHYRGPLRAIGINDDPWATPAAIDLLVSGFTKRQVERLRLHRATSAQRRSAFRILPARPSRHAVARCGRLAGASVSDYSAACAP